MLRVVITLLLICLASPSFAEGIGTPSSLISGLFHPILGFDHLLAMVAVGLLSVQIGTRHVWLLPSAFVIFLMIGGAAGLRGIPLPAVEGVIAGSVFVLGLAIATAGRIGAYLAYPFVAIFAFFHGHAHGGEIPAFGAALPFVLGFMLASAGLHLVGVGLGFVFKNGAIGRHIGSGMAGIGFYMVLLLYAIV